MDRYEDLESIFKLTHGQECNINWFEEGGSIVVRTYDMFFLFEVHPYGGNPQYVQEYGINDIELLLEKAYSLR